VREIFHRLRADKLEYWNNGIMGLRPLFFGGPSFQYSIFPLFPLLILCVLRNLCG
jgi:hypothetical protein